MWLKNKYFINIETDELSRKKWLKYRRYIQFLFGTEVPDNGPINLEIEKKASPNKEAVGSRYSLIWAKKKLNHHLYFKYIDVLKDYSAIDGQAAYAAERAFADAKNFLENVNQESKTVEPKFEAAARCIGGMVHFITDVAHFAHIMNTAQWGEPDDDKPFDNYVAYDSKTRFVKTTSGFSYYNNYDNGGPDWSEIDVGTLKLKDDSGNTVQLIKNGVVQGLRPIHPSQAVNDIAYLTYLGRDEINGFDQHPSEWDPPPSRISNKGKYSAQKLPTLDSRIDRSYGKARWARPYSGRQWEHDLGYDPANPVPERR